MRRGPSAGFTLVEALIAAAVLTVIFGVTFQVLAPSQGIFRAQPEVAVMHQRLRVAVDALAADLRRAGAGPRAGSLAGALVTVVPPVAPVAARGSTAVRDDAISIVLAPPAGAVGTVAGALPPGTVAVPLAAAPCQPVGGAAACGFRAGTRVLVAGPAASEVHRVQAVSPPDVLVLDGALASGYGPGAAVVEVAERSYRLETSDGESTLVRADDGGPAFPVVDRVAALRFEYFDAAGPVPLAALADGPAGPAPAAWWHDADLWRVRRVRLVVRVEAAPGFGVPGREVAVDVTLRSAGLTP